MSTRTNRIIQILIVVFVLSTTAPTFAGNTIYVDDDGPADFNNIQAAIDDSNHGDTIIVADGTYTGDGNRDIDFKGKAITVRSTDPHNSNIVAATIIDCEGSDEDNHRGFYFRSGEDENSILEGLTITNGFHTTGAGICCRESSPTIRNNIITGNEIGFDWDGGAGIGCWRGASPTITNNIISNNTCAPGGGGGGIRCYEAGSPIIANNTISGNSASQGGGMCIDFCNAAVSNCTFSGNSAAGIGGGLLIDSSILITNCTFSNNTASSGAGIYNYKCNPTLVNCYFTGNSAEYRGGAVSNAHASRPTMKNCVFMGNSAGNTGGAIYNHGYFGINEPTIFNCTFATNSALHGSALASDSYLKRYPSNVEMTNCILWDGGDEIWNNDNSAIAVTYSDVEGGWLGEGNIDDDPLFVDPGYWDDNGTPDDANDDVWIDGDYHLLPYSHCINAGDPNYIAGPNETDLDGNPRVICGRIDMGAYESQGPRLLFVDDDASGANDGSSWADAYNYLQDALAACCSSDEVLVAQGIYKPDQGAGITPGDREATFQLINSVTLKGGYAGFDEPDPNACDIQLYETILTGDLAGNDIEVESHYDVIKEPSRSENSDHVVTGSGTNETAVLDSFTITGGNANAAYRTPRSEGGGMYNDDGSPTVNNCIFTNNSARYGGGMINYKSNPNLTNCTFSENSARLAGGMFNCCQSNPTLTNCTFIRNSAIQGGGMENDESTPMLTNCSFQGNKGFSTCAGMVNLHSTAILTNCIFSENLASKYAGMFNSNSNLTITNCSFIGNTAERYSGGMYNLGSTLTLSQCLFSGNLSSGTCGAILTRGSYYRKSHITLTNCTFFGNSGTDGNSLVLDSHSSCPQSIVQLTNCIIWDGENPIWNNDASTISITYSDVHGGWLGQGNIDADPCFVEPGYWDTNGVWIDGDYHLLPDSPCIDTGDPNYIAGPNETDLDGKPRVLDGDKDGVLVVDMGAYEYRFTISAEARIIPRSINVQSKGNWITCYIWLPEGYDVTDIEPNSVFFEDEIQPEQLSLDEQKQVATATFDREKVQSILNVGDIELKITCQLTDGTYFEATDTIKVTDKAGK